MKTKEFLRELSANGCSLKRSGARHDIWYSPITDESFAIPRHCDELAKGLEHRARKVLLGL